MNLLTKGKALLGALGLPAGGLSIAGTAVTATAAELNRMAAAATLAPLLSSEVTFTETATAGTYTGSVSLPAGATLVDIIVHATALWDTGTSATMKIGDVADDDGYYTAVNLKATDLLAGESLSFAQSGGKAGAYNVGTNTHWTTRYSSSARVISGIVTTVGTGTAGRTRMTVVYSLPTATAATKV